MTDPLGQSQVLPYLIGLEKKGYRFSIISCEKPERFTQMKGSIEETIRGKDIQWIPLTYHKSPPVLSSVYDYRQMKNAAVHLYKHSPFDMVHTRPGVPTMVALYLKKRFDVLFMNDVRGFWAQERVDGKMWNLSNPVYKFLYQFFRKHEQECLQLSDQLVCLTNKAKEKIIEEANILNLTIHPHVIPCSVDVDLFNPNNISSAKKQEIQQRLSIHEDETVISYLGSIGGWYLLDEMLDCCKVIYEKIIQVKFLFITPDKHNIIRSKALQIGIPSQNIITVSAKRNEVPAYLSLSHFNLFFIEPAPSKIASCPTKHGEVMAMGIPVLTNAGVGDVKEIIESHDAGLVIHSFSIAEYEKIAAYISISSTNPIQIRNGALKIFQLEDATNSYDKAYHLALSQRNMRSTS